MDTLFNVLRVVVSLGVVFGALWYLQRRLAKGGFGQRRDRTLETVAKQGLGSKSGVAVVDAGGRRYLLGVSEHGVTVLDRLPDPESETTVTPPTPLRVVQGGAGVQTHEPARVPFAQRLADAAGALAGRQAGRPVAVARPSERDDASEETTVTAGGPVALDANDEHETAAAQGEREPVQEETAGPKPASPLAGSILSPDTWRSTAAVLRRAK